MKIVNPAVIALTLSLSACSWIVTKKVPDKWTPKQDLECTEENWIPGATDLVVPPVLLAIGLMAIGVYTSEEDPELLSDGEQNFVRLGQVAGLIGVPWALVGIPSAITGSRWTKKCREAKEKQKEWFRTHPDTTIKP